MAGSDTKGGCIVNLNNMENTKHLLKCMTYSKKNNKQKKEIHTFSNRGLRCSWSPPAGHIFLQTVQQIVLFQSSFSSMTMILISYLEYQQHVLRTRTCLMLTQRLVHEHNLIERWSLRKGEITPIDFSELRFLCTRKWTFKSMLKLEIVNWLNMISQ